MIMSPSNFIKKFSFDGSWLIENYHQADNLSGDVKHSRCMNHLKCYLVSVLR